MTALDMVTTTTCSAARDHKLVHVTTCPFPLFYCPNNYSNKAGDVPMNIKNLPVEKSETRDTFVGLFYIIQSGLIIHCQSRHVIAHSVMIAKVEHILYIYHISGTHQTYGTNRPREGQMWGVLGEFKIDP